MKPTEHWQLDIEEARKEGFQEGIEHSKREGSFLWAVHESMEREVTHSGLTSIHAKMFKGIVRGNFGREWSLTPEDLNANDWEVVS
jgi:hypothetical protein